MQTMTVSHKKCNDILDFCGSKLKPDWGRRNTTRRRWSTFCLTDDIFYVISHFYSSVQQHQWATLLHRLMFSPHRSFLSCKSYVGQWISLSHWIKSTYCIRQSRLSGNEKFDGKKCARGKAPHGALINKMHVQWLTIHFTGTSSSIIVMGHTKLKGDSNLIHCVHADLVWKKKKKKRLLLEGGGHTGCARSLTGE